MYQDIGDQVELIFSERYLECNAIGINKVGLKWFADYLNIDINDVNCD